jgi:glycosyltransferase involved in cell wall biosynthesis
MTSPRPERIRVGFVLERSLGHTTHAANLARVLPSVKSIRPEIAEIPYDVTGMAARVPLYKSNWTVRAGVLAFNAIGRMQSRQRLDALFIHTQVPAVLSQWWMRRIPTVVSLDATPIQYDELGELYAHQTGSPRIERLKWRANRACLHRAVHVVTWSEWARQGVIDGYGVPAERITVIPPGVTPSLWYRAITDGDDAGPVRILFVGGDLPRKGGDVLLRAFAALRTELARQSGPPALELHLVTKSTIERQPDVFVHNDLEPNSPGLIALYHGSDVFCLPTRGDCLPMVLSEAGAAGLPLVSTAVAAIPEIVRDGETGLVVPVDDVIALERALATLVNDAQLRRRLGGAAQALVVGEYDAERNARRLVEVVLATNAEPALAATRAEVRPVA